MLSHRSRNGPSSSLMASTTTTGCVDLLDQHIDGFPHQGMDDGLQLGEGRRIPKHQAAQLRSVDLATAVQDPLAKSEHDRVIAGRALGHGAMRETIGVDRVGPEVLQHSAHDALARGNIACQTNDELARALTPRCDLAAVNLQAILQ